MSFSTRYSKLSKHVHIVISPDRVLGRPLGSLIFSLRALVGDPIYEYFSSCFRCQPRASAIKSWCEILLKRGRPQEGPLVQDTPHE